MSRQNDKRNQLVNAADKLFHQKGINITTLADIASLAKVPLGNVYYYFKSKDSIVEAVIQMRRQQLHEKMAEWNILASARDRLVALIEWQTTLSQETAASGDALGSLCQELGKQHGVLADMAAELLHELIQWCEKQWQALGRVTEAHTLACKLVASLQGMNLLVLSFKDPNLLNCHTQVLLQELGVRETVAS